MLYSLHLGSLKVLAYQLIWVFQQNDRCGLVCDDCYTYLLLEILIAFSLNLSDWVVVYLYCNFEISLHKVLDKMDRCMFPADHCVSEDFYCDFGRMTSFCLHFLSDHQMLSSSLSF